MKVVDWLKNTFRLSLYNPLYVLIIGWITFFCWMSGKSLLGITCLLLIAGFVLIISEDILPVLPCLFFVIFNTSASDILKDKNTFPMLFTAIILLVACIISHFISYPIKFKNYKLTMPLIAVSAALFLGGVGYLSYEQYAYGLTFILTLGPCMLLIYYLIAMYIRPPQNVNYKRYICYIMMTLGLLLTLQVLVYYFRSDKSLVEFFRDTIDLGWGNRNSVAMLMNMCFPCCFYLAFSHRKTSWLYYMLGTIFYGIMVFTMSRGGILAGSLLYLSLLLYSLIKGVNRSQLIVSLSVIAISGSLIVLTHMDTVTELIEKFLDMSFFGNSSSRNELFEEALQNFIDNPVFGAGIGYVGNIFNMPDFCIYWYHSTIFQIIGSMGIVGIVAYTYFYIVRGMIMFKHLKRFNVLLSLGIIAFEVHCLLDNGTFTPFPHMLIVIGLTAIIEFNNTKETTTFLKCVQLNEN